MSKCKHGVDAETICTDCISEMKSGGMTVPGYEDLARILQGAYDQSAKGKGKERHANDKPFNKQPIMEIGRMVGVGGHTYQICKKAQEAGGMVDRGKLEAAKAELRGAMVYAAAAILLIEGMDE